MITRLPNHYGDDTCAVAGDCIFLAHHGGAPARTTVVTQFIGADCLCQMDGIAYKPRT